VPRVRPFRRSTPASAGKVRAAPERSASSLASSHVAPRHGPADSSICCGSGIGVRAVNDRLETRNVHAGRNWPCFGQSPPSFPPGVLTVSGLLNRRGNQLIWRRRARSRHLAPAPLQGFDEPGRIAQASERVKGRNRGITKGRTCPQPPRREGTKEQGNSFNSYLRRDDASDSPQNAKGKNRPQLCWER